MNKEQFSSALDYVAKEANAQRDGVLQRHGKEKGERIIAILANLGDVIFRNDDIEYELYDELEHYAKAFRESSREIERLVDEANKEVASDE